LTVFEALIFIFPSFWLTGARERNLKVRIRSAAGLGFLRLDSIVGIHSAQHRLCFRGLWRNEFDCSLDERSEDEEIGI
jgi:hypothetical protein